MLRQLKVNKTTGGGHRRTERKKDQRTIAQFLFLGLSAVPSVLAVTEGVVTALLVLFDMTKLLPNQSTEPTPLTLAACMPMSQCITPCNLIPPVLEAGMFCLLLSITAGVVDFW